MWKKYKSQMLSATPMRLFALVFAFVTLNAHAQDTKEVQPWVLSAAQVHQGAVVMYQKRIAELDAAHLLDTDADFLLKARRILARLQAQAALDFPESRDWQWELHTSVEPEETAFAMAGGKLLLSLEQARLWNLSETELAMLIAHEMTHALLAHNQDEYAFVLDQFPEWRLRSFAELEQAVDHDTQLIKALAPLGKEQELQADQAGWRLAVRAGYPVAGLLSFFKKLAKQAGYPNFESASHPAPAQRYARARQWAIAPDDSAAANAR